MKNTLLIVALLGVGFVLNKYAIADPEASDNEPASKVNNVATALFAGGCFWCIESDFEKLDGVIKVESGYTGGDASTADYKTVTYNETGHYEAVEVSYAPDRISYSELVEYFWRHIDPTDPDGQFCDKGSSYKSAIFYANQEEQAVIQASLAELNKTKTFDDDIVTTIAAAKAFYLAEEYHQDYYKKNPIRYSIYRRGCGRDKRVEQLWGEQ